ncbi:MAG: CDP-glycerol glycerophosphotransferase family protein [Clostridia bacterium]|nr:CDP-glycerol glycerophosphotransferase family protein [Clostridia bacterium]
MEKIKELIYRCLFIIFKVFPIKKNKLVFINFYGNGYGDNPKYICEELLKKHSDLDIVWLVNNINSNFPKGIRKVKYKSVSAIYELATAKIWIDNARKRKYVLKRKKQYYIQTWHGGIGLKKIEKDAEETLSKYYVESAKHDSEMIDVIISNSKYRTNLYKNSFWYEGEILEVGLPRNDIFFNGNYAKEIKDKILKMYGISPNRKIILYAPTFRKDFNIFEKIDLKLLEQNMPEHIILIRAHPGTSIGIDCSNNVIDVTDYPDMQELIIACDYFISDYSSCIFDAMTSGKAVYLYAPDHDEYLSERGLNFVYDELPFSIAHSNEELISNLTKDTYKNKEEELELFIKDLGIVDDGTASEKIVKRIDMVLYGGKK